MRQANRRDLNQSQLVRDLRAAHFSVWDCSMLGNGFPDILVARNNLNILVEIKDANGKLSAGQINFAREWKGPVIEARTLDDVLHAFAHALARERLTWL